MENQTLFGLRGLADLGARSGIDVRPTLVRVLTDLYVHRLSHTAEEERHYTELALRLLEAVDTPTRVAVARRFARYLSPPLRVLQWLARDLPEVAGELRGHPLLQPPARVVAATPNPAAAPAGWPAPAGENVPGERNSPDDALHLIDTTTAIQLNELFFAAESGERRLILLNLDVVAPTPAGRVLVRSDPSTSQRLEVAVLTGKREDFVQQLARALQIPREQGHRIARDELGEPVVVAGKALSMPRDVLYRILMFINPAVGHSVERVHALAALYDEMTKSAAEGMLAIWQALRQDERPRSKHRPLGWDDEKERHARPGATAKRHATASPPRERRSAS
jgi:Uncharacterised protein conserved in bacteria (DUF2336)